MRGLVLVLGLWLLAACAVPEQPDASDPLLFDAASLARADTAVIGIPGAMSPITVLAPLQRAIAPNRAVGYFRLPGFNGRPDEEWVDIDRDAARIAVLVHEAELKRIDLVGHSTGAVIALEAAKRIRITSPDTIVHVHAISTALPAPQPVLAGVRGAAGTVAAALRKGSLNPRTVWLEYYRELAYGPDEKTDPEVAKAADQLVAANDDRIALPSKGLGRRHTRALRRWRNPNPEALAGATLDFYHGAVDPVFPPRPTARFVATLPDANLTLIEGNGHLLLLTYPEVWDIIIARIEQD